MADQTKKASSTPDPDGAENDSEKARLSSQKVPSKPIARRGEGAFEDLGESKRERMKASGSDLGEELLVSSTEPRPVALRHQRKTTPMPSRRPEDFTSEEVAKARKSAEARRPKSVRASDYEPLTWASSQTRFDYSGGRSIGIVANIKQIVSNVPSWIKSCVSKLNVVELTSLAVFIVVSVIGFVLYLNLLESSQAQPVDRSLRAVDFPVKGKIFSLSEADAFWRQRRPDDVGQASQAYLPEVKLTLSEGSGNIAVLFRDGQGEIQGDPARIRISNGKVESTGDSTVSVVCTSGFENEVDLIWYQGGGSGADDALTWTVYILESPDFDAPLNEWNELLVFDMPGTRSDGSKK